MAETGKVRRRPNVIGIDRGVGPLEAQILRALSESGGPLTVRGVCDHLRAEGYFAYQGILNCMNRLVGKGLLARTLERNAYSYSLRIDLEELTAQVLADVVEHMGVDLERVVCRVLKIDPERGAREIAHLKKKLTAPSRKRRS